MTPLSGIDIVGFWIGIFLTFAILSFLYKDNPFYKLAEHLFIGTSIGYLVIKQYDDNIQIKLVDHFRDGWYKIVPVVLVGFMLVKVFSKRSAWLARFPLAFVVALYAGQQVAGLVQSDLGEQMKTAAAPLYSEKLNLNDPDVGADRIAAEVPGMTPAIAQKLVAERAQQPFTSVDDAVTRPSLSADERAGLADERGHMVGIEAHAAVRAHEPAYFSIVSQVLLLLSFLTALLYFYFSIAHTGVVGRVSRIGVWILMIGFGASFGFTVQGRIALAIGRAQDVMGTFQDPRDAAQIHGQLAAVISIVVIVIGLVSWERYFERVRERNERKALS